MSLRKLPVLPDGLPSPSEAVTGSNYNPLPSLHNIRQHADNIPCPAYLHPQTHCTGLYIYCQWFIQIIHKSFTIQVESNRKRMFSFVSSVIQSILSVFVWIWIKSNRFQSISTGLCWILPNFNQFKLFFDDNGENFSHFKRIRATHNTQSAFPLFAARNPAPPSRCMISRSPVFFDFYKKLCYNIYRKLEKETF